MASELADPCLAIAKIDDKALMAALPGCCQCDMRILATHVTAPSRACNSCCCIGSSVTDGGEDLTRAGGAEQLHAIEE